VSGKKRYKHQGKSVIDPGVTLASFAVIKRFGIVLAVEAGKIAADGLGAPASAGRVKNGTGPFCRNCT
jgi:hypothetical protein